MYSVIRLFCIVVCLQNTRAGGFPVLFDLSAAASRVCSNEQSGFLI